MKKISILLLVVAVALIGVGVFITFQKDENSNSNKQVDVAKLDVLDKANIIEKYFMDKFPITDVDSISNQDKLNFALSTLVNEDATSFTEKRLEKILKAYFGNDVTYENEDIISPSTDKVIAKYDAKKKQYTYNKTTSDNSNSTYEVLSYSNYEEGVNTFDVERQYLVIDKEQSPYVLYSTYQDYENKTNPIGTYDISATDNMMPSSIIDDYITLLPVTTYSFVKQDGVFILKSIIIA